jgi:hypothetical protein
VTGRLARISGVLLSSLLPTISGCGTAGLDVHYPEARVNRTVLASAPPRRVEVRPVADRRMDTTRIGVKPKNSGDIVTSRPVADLVREALVLELSKNGHSVVSNGRDVVLAATVEDFRLDEVAGYASTRYVGRVVIALDIVDERTGEILLTRRYVGIKRREIAKASDEARRETMDAALARTMHDLATDPELAKTLASVRTAATRSRYADRLQMPS